MSRMVPSAAKPDLRLPEFEARQAAALEWIDLAFASATYARAAGVLLMMQSEPTDTPGFAAIRAKIVALSTKFKKPVLLRVTADPRTAAVFSWDPIG